MSRPHAPDWRVINPTTGLEYSAEIARYWFRGRVYDEVSARHNGLVGQGALLAATAKKTQEAPE